MNYMIKTLKMFEFGSWEDATSRTSKMPTTTKWVDRAKMDDNGKMFVRCRLAGAPISNQSVTCSRRCHRWKRRRLYLAFVAGMREKRRVQGHDDVKLMFVKKGTSQREVRRGRMGRAAGRVQKIGEVRQIEETAVGGRERQRRDGRTTTQEDWWSMGFDEAEQHRRYSTIPRRRCE